MTEEIKYRIYNIVLQPTSFCNLSCSYCYLPDKDKKHKMTSDITSKLSDDILHEGRYVNVLWHAGEPMASGLSHFSELLSPFKSNKFVTHIIQTNGTLINQEWCDFFKENNFHIGVSIDGPDWANANRVDRKGKPSYEKTIEGINKLKANGLKFIVIAVVDFATLDKAKELYEFFCGLGCDWVGINIEENECANEREICDDNRVAHFWEELFSAWYSNPIIEMREISSTLSWFEDINSNEQFNLSDYKIDLFPSISYNGDFVVLSPELLGGVNDNYKNFVAGNVKTKSIFDVERSVHSINYVNDFSKGVLMCKEQCDYFSFCRGGQASNKFYETGQLAVTETMYCRNSKKRVVDAIINQLNFK